MKTAIVILNEADRGTAEKIVKRFPDAVIYENTLHGGLPALVADIFPRFEGIVFIMATGIAVRMIAPHLTDKYHDPAVVALDNACRSAISLLSGHEGGANRLAYRVAAACGAEPVVTTATETKKTVTLGIGCRRRVTEEEVVKAVETCLAETGVAPADVRVAGTIDLKKNEGGLIRGCERLGIPLKFFSKKRINGLRGDFGYGGPAERHLGVQGVAEPCALLAGRESVLLCGKRVYGPVTVAVAREEEEAERSVTQGAAAKTEGDSGPREASVKAEAPLFSAAGTSPEKAFTATPIGTTQQGKLYILGTGPGSKGDMTSRCEQAILKADTLVGYPTYVKQLEEAFGPLLNGKEIYTSGMRKEKERASYAIEQARKGKTVCLVSGGDAGVYGLAGLVFELCSEGEIDTLSIDVIPGITAATAVAACLGAPLMHDFVVISLSDLLTDKEKIIKRLELTAEGDFVTVIYNPKSSRRKDLFEKLPEIFLDRRSPRTPVGIVQNAGRPDEKVILTCLGELLDHGESVQMGTTVIIGNSESYVKGNIFITPRGYGV